MAKITVVGLGAGDLEQLPFGIYQMLTEKGAPLFLRTKHHPVVEQLAEQIGHYHSFDDIYEKNIQFEQVYEEITIQLITEARKRGHIIYAVPGHPFVAEKTVQLLVEKHQQGEIEVDIKGGQSFIDAMFTSLEIDPIQGFQFVDALDLQRHQLMYKQHIIICQVYDQMVASEVKLTLMEDLPYDYEVVVIAAAGSQYEEKRKVPLYELDRHVQLNNLTSIYIPPVKDEQILYHQFSVLRSVIAELRGPNGCPWDKEQTHETLKAYLIEECYELLEAIDEKDFDHMIEELGDVMLQIMLHSQIGEDDGLFSIDDVIRELTSKMIRRHPHVFSDIDVENSDEVVTNWEAIKKKEKTEKQPSILDSVAKSLPALSKSYKLQKKAAKVGFDWPNVKEAWLKVREELTEFEDELTSTSRNKREIEKEFGDILFALVNIGRFYDIEPEAALTMTNQKFSKRFRYIEEKVRAIGKELKKVSLEEMDQYWEEAKCLEEE